MFIFQVGPGIVFLLFDQTFLGRGVIVHCVTPVEPLLQCVTHTIFYQSNIPPVVPKFILKVECIQVQCSTIIFYDNYNTGWFTYNLCCHHLTLIYLINGLALIWHFSVVLENSLRLPLTQALVSMSKFFLSYIHTPMNTSGIT